MTQLTLAPPHEGFGATSRRDLWWAGPLATLIGLLIFIIYANIATFQGTHFEIRESAPGQVDWSNGHVAAPYLTPFYSPLLFDKTSPHAWWHMAAPEWWPSWFPFSAAILILPFPLTLPAHLLLLPQGVLSRFLGRPAGLWRRRAAQDLLGRKPPAADPAEPPPLRPLLRRALPRPPELGRPVRFLVADR